MARLRQVPRAEATAPSITMMYDFLFGPDRDPVAEPGTVNEVHGGTRGDWWTVMALVPDAFEHAVAGIGFYRSPKRALPPLLRELGQARCGWVAGSQFVYSQHCKSLRELHVPEELITAVKIGPAASCFDEPQRLVMAYVDCLVLEHGRVSDELFDGLHAHLGDEEILELTYICTLYLQHAVMTRALRLEHDDRPDPVVEVHGPQQF